MFLGARHTATTATVKDILAFTCPACSHRADALVVGVGHAVRRSPARAARKNLSDTFRMARCPKCGARDTSAANGLRAKALASGAFLGALLVAFGLAAAGRLGSVVAAPLAILVATLVFSSQRWKWRTADRRVAFVR